jgi:hypothetical protein
MSELEPQAGETAEQFKMRIEKKQAESAASAKAPAPAASANGPSQAGIDPKLEPKAAQAPAPEKTETPQAPNAPAKADAATASQEADPIDWARKKGLKSEADIARSLRAMEDEFHKRNQNGRQGWKAPEPVPPAPSYPSQPPMSPPSYSTPPASYQPPSYQNPLVAKQQLAQRYNLAPEDLDRVLPLVADVTEARIAQRDQQWALKLATIEKENARNSEFRELMADPFFKDPQVQMEVHRVFEENPSVFESESAPYKWAYNQALSRIGRRNLQGGLGSVENPSVPLTPPTRPPSVGTGGAGGIPEPSTLTPQAFADLPLEDKQKLLVRMGVRPKPF